MYLKKVCNRNDSLGFQFKTKQPLGAQWAEKDKT